MAQGHIVLLSTGLFAWMVVLFFWQTFSPSTSSKLFTIQNSTKCIGNTFQLWKLNQTTGERELQKSYFFKDLYNSTIDYIIHYLSFSKQQPCLSRAMGHLRADFEFQWNKDVKTTNQLINRLLMSCNHEVYLHEKGWLSKVLLI